MIKAAEWSEVWACCNDMLKSYLMKRMGHRRGPEKHSWFNILGQCRGASDGNQLGALLGHCRQHIELSCAECGSSQQAEVQGVG